MVGSTSSETSVRLAFGAVLQPKLTVNAPGDRWEQEADRVADQMLRMPEPGAGGGGPPPIQRMCSGCAEEEGVQRKCAACAEEEQEQILQAKGAAAGPSPAVAPRTEARISSLRGGGRPLPRPVRGYFEPRLGSDLSGVRVHTGGEAASAAREVRARAFTVGSDIAFGAGEWHPESPDGRRLLAHELVHTVQQGGGHTVRRTTYSDCTSDQLRDMVLPARDKAIEDVTVGIARLEERPLSDHTKAALFLAFRGQDEATADVVAENLDDILQGLENGEIQCEQPDGWQYMCENGRLGYTIFAGTMHICMNAWPGVSEKLRTLNLIHEGGHSAAWMIGDPGYFNYNSCEETASTARLSKASRFNTPDAYNCFISYLIYDAGIESRAERYRGANLALSFSPTGVIDLDGADPKSPMFQMSGAPSHSGFRYRWVIADPHDRRYVMRDEAGPTFHFGDHPSSYIGRATRELLKERGVTQGSVRCRVDKPGVGDELFVRDVEFRS